MAFGPQIDSPHLRVCVESFVVKGGAVLVGSRHGNFGKSDKKLISMYNSPNKFPHKHLSESKLNDLLICLTAFWPYVHKRRFQVFTNNFFVLRFLQFKVKSSYALRRIEEIMVWHPELTFLLGNASGLASYLSKHPL